MPTPNAPSSGFFTQGQQNAPYVVYEGKEDYQYDDGSLAIPVAYTTGQPLSPGQRQPQEIVQVSAPISRRVVSFRVARLNALPVLPAPTPLNANENLTNVDVQTLSPVPTPNGDGLIYRTVGTYVFDQKVPVVPGTDPLNTPGTDATVGYPGSVSQPTLLPTQFRTGLF